MANLPWPVLNMLKSKGKTDMAEEPSHVKQLSLNHVCKIGFTKNEDEQSRGQTKKLLFLQFLWN